MPSNTAAWLTGNGIPLEVKPAPYESPRENEIVIKTAAVAINPVDWGIQTMGKLIFPQITYPCINGSDVAGEVVEVGPHVSRFKPGDRVLGHAVAVRENEVSFGAFQHYTVLLTNMAAPIPRALAYERAAVVPLALSTAACGLFQDEYLALPRPSLDPKPAGKTLLVWGAATSVGSCAVQLAVAAGYEVVATASPRNWDYVRGLGASRVFDYGSASVIVDIVGALQGKDFAGAMAIGSALSPGNGAAAADACVQIVDICEGRKFVALAMRVSKELPRGVEANFILGSALKDNDLGKAIYEDFLPKALAEGKFVAAPEPLVVGKGLEFIQRGYEVQKKGVSARKVVVTL